MKSFLKEFKDMLIIAFVITLFFLSGIGIVIVVHDISWWFIIIVPFWIALFSALGIESLKRK